MRLLTRCEYDGRYAACGVDNGQPHVLGESVIPLTNQHPELVSHRQVPVLCSPFRARSITAKEGGYTIRKSAKTISSLVNAAQRSTFPTYPMIYVRAKHI